MEGTSVNKLSEVEERELFQVIREGKYAKIQLDKMEMGQEEKEINFYAVKKAEEAKLKIFFAHTYLIENVRYNYYSSVMYGLEDVMQDAAIVLLTCIDKYDCRQDCRFATYAAKAIGMQFVDSMAKNYSMIHSKKNFVKNLWKRKRFESDYYKMHGRQPEPGEITEHTGLGKRALEHTYRFAESVVSYDSGISLHGEEEMEMELGDGEISPLDEQTDTLSKDTILHKQVKAQLFDIIKKHCSEKEQMILDYRFGFHGTPMKNGEIAEKMGITENEVGLITARTIIKLEEPCRKMELDQIFR